MKRRYSWLLAAALFLLTVPCVVHAQTSCADALAQAQKLYDLGQFEDVVNEIQPCLAAKLSRATAIQVHSLLARAWLYADQPEKASKEVSTLLRLDSAFDAGAAGRFAALVTQVKREEQTTQVVSVSKTSESLREAPATVVVVTGDEIERRGYSDLEQLLHDLPGFDVSRVNGDIYASIFQRGYFAPMNDRLLFLIDGVEQNELSQGSVYLSRQYPLTNIDRVEVIYGPASTMYGANAYTGVISIVTKDPEAVIGENKRFGIIGKVTAGGYGTRGIDVTAAGSDGSGTVSWSLAGQFQKERERDLSGLDDWDFSFRNFDYKAANRLTGADAEAQRAVLCAKPSPYIQCTPNSIELTDAGAELMRGLDRAVVDNNGLGFADRSKNWAFNGKVKISNLTIGLQSWRSQEGVISGFGAMGTTGNASFTPKETAIYLRYSVSLARAKLNVFTRYLQTSIDRGASNVPLLHTYAAGFLSMASLVPPCKAEFDPTPVACAPAVPWVEQDVNGSLSNQIHNEVSVAFEPSERLSGVTGLEFVKSSIQSQYDQTTSGPGTLFLDVPKVEQNEHTDAALWAQGSWKPRRSLRFIAAGRLSYNEINNHPGVTGFGYLFTPRLGVIYTPGARHLVLKAIYSEAFKDPTDREKFGSLIKFGRLSNPALRPERVRNVELSADWEAGDRLSVQGSLYQARYTGVVQSGFATGDCQGCTQDENSDTVRIRGLEATARYKLATEEIWANFTHIDPIQSTPSLDGTTVNARIADVAANQVNLGIDSSWRRLTASLRTHYSARRPAGVGTTFADSPLNGVDAFSTTAVALSVRDILPKATLQLAVSNVFNKNYYDGGSDFSITRVLQAGRTFRVMLIYRQTKEGAESSR
jgi:outer membrane receptor for ferrienterochelin and colicins